MGLGEAQADLYTCGYVNLGRSTHRSLSMCIHMAEVCTGLYPCVYVGLAGGGGMCTDLYPCIYVGLR